MAMKTAQTFPQSDHLPCKLMTWYNGWLDVARTITVTYDYYYDYGEDGRKLTYPSNKELQQSI